MWLKVFPLLVSVKDANVVYRCDLEGWEVKSDQIPQLKAEEVQEVLVQQGGERAARGPYETQEVIGSGLAKALGAS